MGGTTSKSSYLDFFSHSVAQTRRIGARLGELSQPGDVFLLQGGLGSGKTCLAQGIAAGLKVSGQVVSPTFVLVGCYRGRLPLYHIDLFRIASSEEAWALGLEEMLYDEGVCVVEWPERAADLFPPEHLKVHLKYVGETKRNLRLEPEGERYLRLVAEFKQYAFAL